MQIVTCFIAFVFLSSSCGDAIIDEEHVNAKILGKLVYSDLALTIDHESARSVFDDFENRLGIILSVLWKEDDNRGVDPTTSITLDLPEQPALVLLERIVAQLDSEGNAAWQLRHGALEIGLKTQLASQGRQRLETYYIHDLLFTIRDFSAPDLEMPQGTGGGGGGTGGGDASPKPDDQEKKDQIIELITTFVEPDLWEQHGGPCSISYYNKTLLIQAPDFIHRQINGYTFLARQPEHVRERRVLYNRDKTRVIVDRLPLR